MPSETDLSVWCLPRLDGQRDKCADSRSPALYLRGANRAASHSVGPYSFRAKREGAQVRQAGASVSIFLIALSRLLDVPRAIVSSWLLRLQGRLDSEPSSARYAVPCRASPTKSGVSYGSRSYSFSSKIAALFGLAESHSSNARKFSWGYVSHVIGFRQSVTSNVSV